jgi:hypothetical protein
VAVVALAASAEVVAEASTAEVVAEASTVAVVVVPTAAVADIANLNQK